METPPKRGLRWRRLAAAGLAAVALALAGFALPRERTITAAVRIAAEPGKVFSHIVSPRRWMEWHPWGPEFYPDMRREFSGPQQGVGAVWVFKERWSSGRIEVTQVLPPAHVGYISRINGGRYTADWRFDLVVESAATHVTWQCTGDAGNNPFARAAMAFSAGVRDQVSNSG